MSFAQLGLSADILRAIEQQGYTTPTPIQRQAIPVVLTGRDVLAAAQTGTGKTAGFTLPLLQRLSEKPHTGKSRPIRALVLTPTRELAAQIAESVRCYSRYLPLRSAVVFGGVKINPQIETLRQGVDILVATPGRLLDHVGQKTVSLAQIEILVLDEGDRMLDMGFIHDIRRILALLPVREKRQSLLFSATFSTDIRQLANRLLNRPELIEVAPRNATADRIEQQVYAVERTQKRALLSHLIQAGKWSQVLVFTRTKHGANRLAQQLQMDGLASAAIHGNKSQAARTRALAEFKAGQVRVLVATDIAARGLDIDQLPYVVNYELPHVPEDYVHRIGRTARAGSRGEAISLVEAEELPQLKAIEKLLSQTLRRSQLPEFARSAHKDAPAMPRSRSGGERSRAAVALPRRQRSRRRNPSASGTNAAA